MKKIDINVAAVVEELKNIKVQNVIFEAIMNAMQANATHIDIKIIASSLDDKNNTPYIDQIEVVDNGDGFNEENTKSFGEYRSAYKRHFGCKGVGRFMYLKLFRNVKIMSAGKEFDFTCNGMSAFKELKYDKTKVVLSSPKSQLWIDFSKIKKEIEEHFLAYFKTAKETIQIGIYRNNEQIHSIKSSEIPNFEKKEFKIKKYAFTISYLFGEKDFKNEGFYVANNRVVVRNSELEQDSKYDLPKENDIRIFYILESDYFNSNVNDERNELQIYPKQRNSLEFQDLSWNEIHSALENQLNIIYKEHGLDIENTIRENRKIIFKKLPYLGAYIVNRNELNINNMLENAKKEFEKDKLFLRNDNSKNNVEYESKLAKVTQAELAEYIFDRNKLILQLKNAVKRGDIEEKIHNLFMPKKTFGDGPDYKSNNAWLFDDRFMSYDKIFSDMQIKDIFPELYNNLERPDLLSIISNSYEQEKITDILLVEFKRPEANRDYFSKANRQILSYISSINTTFTQKSLRIWAYAFLKFDDDVLRDLVNDDYNQIYAGSRFPICYKYNKANNVIVNFMDYNSLICDAENRNQLFLDILKGKYL